MQLERIRPRRWPWITAGAVLLVGALGVLTNLPKPPLPVDVTVVAPGLVEETVTGSSVGTVEADQTAIVTAEVAGRVKAIHLRQGDAKAGARIVELDTTDLDAEREQTVRDLKTWRLRADQARLRVDRTDAELKRVSASDESEWRKEALVKDLAIAKKDVDIAEATVRTQEAALAVVELRLKKASIAAPFAGVVTKLHVEIGEAVTPGRQLFTFQSGPPFLVRAPIDETDVGRLQLGLQAKVTFDAFRERAFAGELVEIKPAASVDQKNNRTVDVKVRVKEIPPTIVTGMSAHVELILAERPGVVRIQTAHIREDHAKKTKYVYVVENATIRRRDVETGLWNWEWTEVARGLAPDDRVVVRVTVPARETELADGVKAEAKDAP